MLGPGILHRLLGLFVLLDPVRFVIIDMAAGNHPRLNMLPELNPVQIQGGFPVGNQPCFIEKGLQIRGGSLVVNPHRPFRIRRQVYLRPFHVQKTLGIPDRERPGIL